MVSNITRSADTSLSLSPPPPPPKPIKDDEIQVEEMFAESKEDLGATSVINLDSESHQNEMEIEQPAPALKKAKKRKQSTQQNQKKKTVKNAAGEMKTKVGKKGGKKNEKKDKDDQKKAKVKENHRTKVKNDAAPYLQVQEDGTFQIINQTEDDDTEKTNSKPKKTTEKHKIIARRVPATADKRDSSWVCVFCKFEAHKFKLGDLFGPYIISTTSPEYALCLEDPANDIFKQGNQNKFAPVKHSIASPPNKKKGKLTSQISVSPEINLEVFNDMTKVDDTNYEIWFHEDCIVWAPGTYIIGSNINNLEAAVWHSTRHRCTMCQKNGAMMACLHRGCKKEAHFVCARKSWKLCDNFKTFCDEHFITSTE
jgi:hypothetical protein